jgi:PAS domain S-box-containing protein
MRTLAELRETGVSQPFEKEYLRKDGSRVPVLVGSVCFDETRTQGVAFVLDLTERKRGEDELRASEERFRTLVQFSFDVYWESDAQHRFIRQEFAEGLTDAPAPGSEIGKTRWEVPYLEPDTEAWRKHRETLDAHLPFRDFEIAGPAPDGGKRYVSVSGLPVFDKSGRFIGYRGVGRHITERKKVEEALRRSEAYLAGAQRLSQSGAFAYNEKESLYWSEGLYRIWGFDPSQGIPSREACFQLFHPDDRNRVYEVFQEALRQRRDYTIEYRIVLPDGTLKHLQSIGHHSFSAAGEFVEVVGTTIDVTERKRAQEEHERLQQLEADLAHMNRLGIMGELTASLAHELLHPIATARNNARAGMRFLEMSPPNLAEVMEALACVVRVTAQVSENVYDSPTGIYLLIPQGARLIGQYDSQIAFGQSRVLLVWTRLLMPNGKSIVLERQPGADTSGYSGLEDEVDNHWGALLKAALLSTLLSVGSEAGTTGNQNDLVQAIRRGGSESFNQVGQRVVSRNLDIQPTLTIRPGFPVRVIVNRDLVLAPYNQEAAR